MKILLRWLVEYAWAFYVVCAIGALIYLVRALSAQRERSLALFTIEHETATVRAVRAWVMVFAFVAFALVVFISATFMANNVPAYDPTSPRPTPTQSSGVNPPTPGATVTLTDAITMPTLSSETPTPPPPTSPVDPTEPPTPAPTPTSAPVAAGPLSGGMDIQFGDFGRLVGYELSSGQIVSGESLAVTLYWQALEGNSPVNYTVFTHLLAEDGQLIAQHDGPPANGSAPTNTWEAGETIQDPHQLTFKSEAGDYTGPATVMVGLYDPGNINARVNTNQGQDYAILPVTVNVAPR